MASLSPIPSTTYIHTYIQLLCGPAPPTVPGISPKTTESTKNRRQQKLRPGGVPEGLGKGLGTILGSRGAQEVSQ